MVYYSNCQWFGLITYQIHLLSYPFYPVVGLCAAQWSETNHLIAESTLKKLTHPNTHIFTINESHNPVVGLCATQRSETNHPKRRRYNEKPHLPITHIFIDKLFPFAIPLFPL